MAVQLAFFPLQLLDSLTLCGVFLGDSRLPAAAELCLLPLSMEGACVA